MNTYTGNNSNKSSENINNPLFILPKALIILPKALIISFILNSNCFGDVKTIESKYKLENKGCTLVNESDFISKLITKILNKASVNIHDTYCNEYEEKIELEIENGLETISDEITTILIDAKGIKKQINENIDNISLLVELYNSNKLSIKDLTVFLDNIEESISGNEKLSNEIENIILKIKLIQNRFNKVSGSEIKLIGYLLFLMLGMLEILLKGINFLYKTLSLRKYYKNIDGIDSYINDNGTNIFQKFKERILYIKKKHASRLKFIISKQVNLGIYEDITELSKLIEKSENTTNSDLMNSIYINKQIARDLLNDKFYLKTLPGAIKPIIVDVEIESHNMKKYLKQNIKLGNTSIPFFSLIWYLKSQARKMGISKEELNEKIIKINKYLGTGYKVLTEKQIPMDNTEKKDLEKEEN